MAQAQQVFSWWRLILTAEEDVKKEINFDSCEVIYNMQAGF